MTLQTNSPLVEQRADPFVHKHSDGFYYFTGSVPTYDRIELRKSATLEGLKDAETFDIWFKHDSGPMSRHIWAPEIHYLDGKWYIYFAASEEDDIWALRPYVLECKGQDPLNDEWVELGMMQAAEGDEKSFTDFSLDATIFENNGKIFIAFSASATGACYCMGYMEANENSDLLDRNSWTKTRMPVLETSVEKNIFGPGHNCFTVAEDGETPLCIYHARDYEHAVGEPSVVPKTDTRPLEEIVKDPLYDPNRHARVMEVKYDGNGRPLFELY